MSDSQPRALLATRVFPPDANAAAFRLGALTDALERSGFVTTVMTVKQRADQPNVEAAIPALVKRFPVLRDAGGNVRGYVQYMSFDIPLAFRLLGQRKQDVWISEAPPTTGAVVAVAALLRRRPFVYYAADVFSDGVAAVGAPRIVVRLMRALETWVLRRAAAVLSVSEQVSRRIASFGVDPERIVEVGHGIDTTVFNPSASVVDQDRAYFVYTGTMSEVHNAKVFVTAFSEIAAEFPEVDLRFFGQGVHVAEMQRMADELTPGRVIFDPIVPAHEAASWIRGSVAALVSLQPGIGYDYAHPTKAYAAAATGTQILYAGPDSFGDIVKSAEIGIAVPHDAHEVAAAMREILTQRRADAHADTAREARAVWARNNVAIDAVGDRAAAAVRSVLRVNAE